MKRQFNTWQTTGMVDRIGEIADEKGISKSAVVALAVDSLSDCGCRDGILGRCAGHWIYCHCRAGMALAMEHLDKKMSILAEDLATMPAAESNRRERESKQRQLNALDAEYRILEDEFEKLDEHDWACPECEMRNER